MNITLLKYPTDEDWSFAKQCALVTIGKKMKTAPDMEWKHSILRARPFIRSQRNDRQSEYNRNAARQDAPVDMIWCMNAEELLTIAEKRLCHLAAKETRDVAKEICALVIAQCPEFAGLLTPPCVQALVCREMNPCKYENILTWRDANGHNSSD